jgi:signal transduction histidine kinase
MQGTYTPISTSAARPPTDGRLTARHEIAAAQQSLTPSVKAHVEALLTAERLKDEFMATLSHELRSPLVAVDNAVRILSAERGQDPVVQQKMHTLIERQVRHMMLLVAGLRDISRISRGNLQLQREKIDLCVVLANALETMQPEIQQRGQSLATRWPEEPVWLQADSDRLDQVFQNLLDNASKYTNPGGQLALSLHVRDRYAIVRLRDSGIGIAADMLPEIFNLFMQVGQSAPRARSGLGIGLALVRTLVELHGGRVSALSAGIGHGSEFTVRLPIDESAD